MTPYIIFVLFVLGLIIGSFLNVVILRYDTGLKISRGRSKCFSCNKTLKWYELLPIASFAAQKGRCRGCKSKISWQYPFVELATALALPLAYISTVNRVFDIPVFILTSAIFFLYIIIFVYDIRHKIIPDLFSYSASLIALALVIMGCCDYVHAYGQIDWYRLMAGPALFLFFFFFWAVSRGKWMGLGDAKLALSVGWFLGLGMGISAILLSFWIGAITVLIVALLQKKKVIKGRLGLKSEVPFGPFILIGATIVYLFPDLVMSLLGFLSI